MLLGRLSFLGNQNSEDRGNVHLPTDAWGPSEVPAGWGEQGGSFHGTASNGSNCLPAKVLTAPLPEGPPGG